MQRLRTCAHHMQKCIIMHLLCESAPAPGDTFVLQLDARTMLSPLRHTKRALLDISMMRATYTMRVSCCCLFAE